MPDLDDALLRDFLDLAFDFVCARPLRDLVDPEAILPGLDAAATPERLARFQRRLVVPARARLLERAGKSALTLGDWLPEDVKTAIATMLGAPAPIPRKVIDEMVASEQVRDAVRTMLQESLSNFVTRATSGSGGSGGAGGALKDAFGWGARVAGAAGQKLLGGLSGEIQKQLQEKVKDFVDGAVGLLQQRIAERLGSRETAKALGQQRKRAFLGMLKRTEAQAALSTARMPHDQIDPLIPRVIAHNAARTAVREALVAEVRAALEELSTQSVGELLDESGQRALAREALHRHGLPLARELVRTPGFGALWARATQGATESSDPRPGT